MKIYLKGNKPFYARVLHRDATGATLQILPNSYRTDNYFHGGTVYEIPTGNDPFDLEVAPPFGEETLIVYAASSPLGGLDLQEKGAFYQVKTGDQDTGVRTRGLKLQPVQGPQSGQSPAVSEFFETRQTVKTAK